MVYQVLDDCNVLESVSGEDIEKAIAEKQVTYMIMQAMGQSHCKDYMKYVLPFLDGEYFYIRRAAIQAVINIDGRLGLEALKKKCAQYSLEDEDPWNKILFTVAIMMVETGTEGMKAYFDSEEGDARIKDTILTFYHRGYQFEQDDIKLICHYLKIYINKSFGWIGKMPKAEWKESVCFAFESFGYIIEMDSNMLSECNDELSEEICGICEAAIEKGFGQDTNYDIALISQYVRKEYAIRILRALKEKARGTAKTEMKKALKKWNLALEEL